MVPLSTRGKHMCGIQSVSVNGAVAVRANGQAAAILSWDGFHKIHARHRKVTEADVLAFASFLEKRGLEDEALELLEEYLSGHNVKIF